MVIHDWARVPTGLFHHFRQDWSIEITRRLNHGILPKGMSALVEQSFGPRRTRDFYAGRANRIVVKHHLGRIIAVIEIMSPGNKDSRAALRLRGQGHRFPAPRRSRSARRSFSPTVRDPFGMHKVIWDEIHEEDFAFPAGKDRILASYETGGERVAYVEPIAVGDLLPDMPLFLANGIDIKVPLESTYCAAWEASPEEMRQAVETGILPEEDEG